jgi:zinc and cadmium transporter
MSRARVLAVNIMTALTTVLFAVITFALGSADRLPIGFMLGLSAGFLLYIAASDIIPSIHKRSHGERLLNKQTIMLALGVAVVGLAIQAAHGYIDEDHDYNDGHAHIENAEHEYHDNHHHGEHDHDEDDH